jgi:hypothetical protein
MYRPTTTAPEAAAAVPPASVADPWRLACEVADVLARMSRPERLRAYRSRVFTPQELSVAAAWLPEEMPRLNGDWEWLAFDLE